MYFAILWKNPSLSLEELELLKPTDLTKHGAIVTFSTDRPEYLPQLGGIVKFGEIISPEELSDELKDTRLIGTNDEELGLRIKKNLGIKRYKLLELEKTDLEVKNKGLEIVSLQGKKLQTTNNRQPTHVWIVKGYQNIPLLEAIDFEKPSSGMQIGMMPAKLAQILINLGLNKLWTLNSQLVTLYDPFCGFGTTGFVANALGHNFIGSDLNIIQAKQNLKRRTPTPYNQPEPKFTLFKHDVKDAFDQPFLKHVNLIVTEGRLGPVVKQNLGDNESRVNQDKIFDLYKQFLENVGGFYEHITLVFTVPYYIDKANFLNASIQKLCEEIWFEVKFLEHPYARKGQRVGRQIVVCRK